MGQTAGMSDIDLTLDPAQLPDGAGSGGGSDGPIVGTGGADGGMTPEQKTAFSIINVSTAPVWLAMILFPNARLTKALVKVTTPLIATLGVIYSGYLMVGLATSGERVNFADGDSVRRTLQNPNAFIAGWTHYLAFDLFMGRYIWQESLAAGKRARLPLLLTWLAGPMGFTLFLARRVRWNRSA